MGLIQFITSLGKKSDPSNKTHPHQADGYKPVLPSEHSSNDKLTTTSTRSSSRSQQHEHEGFGSSFSMRFNEENVPAASAAASSSPPRFGNTHHIPPPTPDEGGGNVTPHWEPYYLFGKSSNPANEKYIKIDE
ncbi:hypothetical protein O0I10_000208 [Lichtheimia ornata]|uniref:Uncharacterized protein n=1 Tax=Lichtheimia ornata TaxID=688661 RepID=A0AAD8DJP9_9FUNG|nr:uncharacterized protein O0I10_000208 [Lichtheimia ornata]KAJ8663933.1 hypothetical protein O0I10_000208 [Lichtheimia ornata]